MAGVKANLERLQLRINGAARRAGREPKEITLVAVSKDAPVERIKEGIEAGIDLIGESKVQEARSKFEALKGYPRLKWHLVGHLQRNKVKAALEIFSLIHSVHRLELAEEIDKRAKEKNKVAEVLIEVNTSGEAAKFGVAPEGLLGLVREAAKLENLKILGLMTLAPLLEEPEQARPCFRRLRELKEEIEMAQIPKVEMRYLSMGMSEDFETAIEEGANLIRIGRAIFGVEHKRR